MPQAIGIAIAKAAYFIAAKIGVAATNALIIGGANLAAAAAFSAYSRAQMRRRLDRSPEIGVTVRSAVAPRAIVYGTMRLSGPISYVNQRARPGSNNNSELWHVIALAGHECEDITDVWLDGDRIPNAIINWGAGGNVTTGKYGPINNNDIVNFYKQLGTDAQTVQTNIDSAFTDWTSNHRLRGVTYLVSRFELGKKTTMWETGAPQNIRAVVKGKKIYDPRLDSTSGVSGASGSHRPDDPSTWAWSDNPALCLADYMIDERLGMGAEGVSYLDIDYQMVADAADVCDTLVNIPGSTTEERYTCNGVLYTTSSYQDNITALLTSMNGTMTWSGGKFRIRAGAYEAPIHSFDDDDIIADVQIQAQRPRTERFNTVRGTYIDPERQYQPTEMLRVVDTNYRDTRDIGQELISDISLPMTNSEYMAQRIAWKRLQQNNQQLRCTVTLNWSGLKVAPGDRIQLTISDLSWSNKVFVVKRWRFDPERGFVLNLREDSSSAYDDPEVADYSVRTAAGTVSFADPQVPAPSGLTATSVRNGILVEWEQPTPTTMYDQVAVYASADSAWANASEIWRGRATRYLHELGPNITRYYWARSLVDDGSRESDRDPDSDTSSVVATAGAVDFADIDGATKPEDNATAGATWGTDVTGQPVDSGQNIVTDPRFTASAAAGGFGTWWTTVGPAPTIGATAAEDGGPAAVWGVTAGSSIVAALRFPIRDGDVIFGRVRAFFSSAYASAADFRLELRLLDKDGGDLSAYPNVVTISSPTLNAWDTYSGTLTVNNASARYAEIWVTGAPSAGLVYVDDVYIARAEDGADTTANNGQPPSWLTALIDSGDIDAASVEAVLDALNLINPPAEAGASSTDFALIDLGSTHIIASTETTVDGWVEERSATFSTTVVSTSEIELDEAAAYIVTAVLVHEIDNDMLSDNVRLQYELEQKPSGGSYSIISGGVAEAKVNDTDQLIVMRVAVDAGVNERIRLRGQRIGTTTYSSDLLGGQDKTKLIIERFRG